MSDCEFFSKLTLIVCGLCCAFSPLVIGLIVFAIQRTTRRSRMTEEERRQEDYNEFGW